MNSTDYIQLKTKQPERLTQDRWSLGIDHHPMSARLMAFMSKHDQHEYNMYFDWRTGGDGDNGESAMYQMDPFFEWLDQQTESTWMKEGEVAIVFRPSYGMGWSSYVGQSAKNPQWFASNGVLARLVDGKDWEGVEQWVNEHYPGMYLGSLDQLKIQWLPKGTVFEITEHDGYERIEIKSTEYLIA